MAAPQPPAKIDPKPVPAASFHPHPSTVCFYRSTPKNDRSPQLTGAPCPFALKLYKVKDLLPQPAPTFPKVAVQLEPGGSRREHVSTIERAASNS
jgi:hypothetical protein